ncbi:MAG: ubiquinol oxidase subunit II [Pseudomonadota bacterium]
MKKNVVVMGKIFCLIILSLALSACNFILFDPKGPVASTQMTLIIVTTLVMLIVVIPVTIMGVWFPYRYRKSNTKHEYKPDWEHSNKIEAVVWTIPILIIIVLGVITYITSFSLDPRKPIESDKPAIVVQVVAMDWKWLFIYPEHEIATVNELAIPVDVPVEFLVTSDTVMNSFFIPQLGSMIYAMSGMENRLHLMATEPGIYPGYSANYSGFGFSGMKFDTHASSEEEFQQWLEAVKNADNPLTDEVMTQLRVKSRDVDPIRYSSVNPLLFSDVIERFTGAINGR